MLWNRCILLKKLLPFQLRNEVQFSELSFKVENDEVSLLQREDSIHLHHASRRFSNGGLMFI